MQPANESNSGDGQPLNQLSSSRPRVGIIQLLIVLTLWSAIFAISEFRYRGPEISVTEDAQHLSGENVREILRDLVGDGIPHPAGSEQNDIVRQRIIDRATNMGYEVLVHEAEHYPRRNPENPPVALQNLMFRLPGTAPQTANAPIVLAAHYDSARNAPGAGDDGVGVAVILETARRWKLQPAPRNDIIFLITDGEELGLLGAQRWAEQHPWAKEAKWVINLEARGTCGASLMFETSTPNGWLAQLLGRQLLRPNASSLSYEIYRRLPNDTDFTVFREAGLAGFNFAFIGDVRNYHTPGDSWENVSPNSIQHHADNSWQLLGACANFEWPLDDQGALVPLPSPGQAVYFDMLGWFLIRWPTTWNWWLFLVPVIGLSIWIVSEGRISELLRRGIFRGIMGSLLTAVGLCFVVTTATLNLWLLQKSPSLELSWPLRGGWVHVSIFLSAALGWLLVSRLTSRWFWDRIGLASLITLWLIVGVLLCWQVPGGSFLVIAPLWCSGVAIVAVTIGLRRDWAPAIWVLSCGLIWVPFEPMFYDALGMGTTAIFALRLAWLASCFLPWFTMLTERAAWLCCGLLGGGWLITTFVSLL